MLTDLIPQIEAILSAKLPANAWRKVSIYKGAFGSEYVAIRFAGADYNINGVRGQRPLSASLRISEDMELQPSSYGGQGGRRLYFKVLPTDHSFNALHGVNIPFRTPKKEAKHVLKAVERFAVRWLETIAANTNRLLYTDVIDYPTLLGIDKLPEPTPVDTDAPRGDSAARCFSAMVKPHLQEQEEEPAPPVEQEEQPAKFADGVLTIQVGEYTEEMKSKDISHSWHGTSYSPEKRAESYLKELCQTINWTLSKFKEIDAKVDLLNYEGEARTFCEKHLQLVRVHLSAKASCMSSMIAGPSNFPVKRARGANDREHTRGLELYEHPKKAIKSVERQAWPHGKPGSPIRSSNPDALELLQTKLAGLEKSQLDMKTINAIHRKCTKEKMTPEDYTDEIRLQYPMYKPSTLVILADTYGNGKPFKSYSLSNNNANIKSTRDRIEQLTKLKDMGAEAEPVEIEIEGSAHGGITVEENTDAMRIQIFFPWKPEDEIRTLLKRNGMRWSPRFGAWQRQLTANGKAAVYRVIVPKLKEYYSQE